MSGGCYPNAAYVIPLLLFSSLALGFSVDTSEQPASHPPETPADGAETVTNPPAMVWRFDERAATYTLEMSQDPGFTRGVVRVEGIDMPFYNHSAVLDKGTWHWRYYVVAKKGETSEPSPVKRFIITDKAIPFPVPKTEDILKNMPAHPRIFVTRETLDEFRKRRVGPAKEAWEEIKYQADKYAKEPTPNLKLAPFPVNPGKERGKLFRMKDGKPFVVGNLTPQRAQGYAKKAFVLGLAYLITGEKEYGEAAKRWLLWMADFRVDYHLKDRAEHDSVVYCYEYALKYIAVTFDYVYDLLSEEERKTVLEAVRYQGIASIGWIRDKRKLHLNYQNSHGQQNMHALLTTTLAVATDLPEAREWADWLIRQYVNHVAWGSADGGYTEGQTYSHKVQFILEGLCALRSSTGLDVFKKPRWHATGDFWMYCMSLNYWWNHWGDCYQLLMPMYGNGADAYIANFLASMTDNPYVKWWSGSLVASPAHVPLQYLSGGELKPKPPVDIPQARLFPEVGQLAAYDRFYDHVSPRIFFRASPWGSHSHSHCDQNGFVIHAFGEILAPEAGYYTYCGDTYHRGFSVQTVAHNSVLVNGEGQPKSITSKGRFSAFFNSPRYCFFVGDASEAYEGKLTKFYRAVLFIRPDVFVIYDQLEAPEPSDFTWLLHSFEPAEIDQEARRLTVKQRDARLTVTHTTPSALEYSQDNKRPYPIMTRKWTRYSDMFPQPWTIRVKTKAKAKGQRFLTVLHAHKEGESRIESISEVGEDAFQGVSFQRDGKTFVALFQNDFDAPRMGAVGDLRTDAVAFSCVRDRDGGVPTWMAHQAKNVHVGGKCLFKGPSCGVAVDGASGAAGAQVCVSASSDGTALLGRPEAKQDTQMAVMRPGCAPQVVPVEMSDGAIQLRFDAGETAFLLNPARDPKAPLPSMALRMRDGQGEYTVPLETAVAGNGDIIAFAELNPREPGVYTVASSNDKAELLLQDRWDPTVTRRGEGRSEATLREGCEFFARFPAGADTPKIEAQLKESFKGRIVSLLRNGNFEEGIPLYPPRGWTVRHNRQNDLGWPGWCTEGACEGKACMKIVRDKGTIRTYSQPMRLRTPGRYVLRFKAKGTVPSAAVSVKGARGTAASIKVEPGAEWKEYRTELDAQPGSCIIGISVPKGEPGRTLWLDDMEFGYLGQ